MEVVLNEWNAADYAAKSNLLRIVRQEAEALFALADGSDCWSAPTACERWAVRDVVGHLIDVTEGYFTSFDAARSGTTELAPLGMKVMRDRLDEGAREYRELPRSEAMERLRSDFAKMLETFEALDPDDWAGLMVPHKFIGPLPAYFYPVFQLMDYGVHGWDIRQGTGRAHGLGGDAADLLAPFMFVLWQATAIPPEAGSLRAGVRVFGRNSADYLVTVAPEGMSYAEADLSDAPCVIEFDPASLVLTAFGRINAGTIRGDRRVASTFLNSFFRI
jgi:uncharacterized protein (TIGR03083 family)